MSFEEIIFTIISQAGTARSMCFEALKFARNGEFEKADKLIEEAKNELIKTHDIQNTMIQKEAMGQKQEVSLLLVHAEDHLMNAILAKDLISEMIKMYKQNRYKGMIDNDR